MSDDDDDDESEVDFDEDAYNADFEKTFDFGLQGIYKILN